MNNFAELRPEDKQEAANLRQQYPSAPSVDYYIFPAIIDKVTLTPHALILEVATLSWVAQLNVSPFIKLPVAHIDAFLNAHTIEDIASLLNADIEVRLLKTNQAQMEITKVQPNSGYTDFQPGDYVKFFNKTTTIYGTFLHNNSVDVCSISYAVNDTKAESYHNIPIHQLVLERWGGFAHLRSTPSMTEPPEEPSVFTDSSLFIQDIPWKAIPEETSILSTEYVEPKSEKEVDALLAILMNSTIQKTKEDTGE